jgi:hypothetical protein
MDRYEATWQMMVSYVYGLLIGNLIFLPVTTFLAPASIVGGAILALPLLLLGWVIMLIFFDHIHARLRIWCVIAPVAVCGLWLAGELALLAGKPVDWRGYVTGTGPRVALALVCASLASMKYYRSATAAH